MEKRIFHFWNFHKELAEWRNYIFRTKFESHSGLIVNIVWIVLWVASLHVIWVHCGCGCNWCIQPLYILCKKKKKKKTYCDGGGKESFKIVTLLQFVNCEGEMDVQCKTASCSKTWFLRDEKQTNTKWDDMIWLPQIQCLKITDQFINARSMHRVQCVRQNTIHSNWLVVQSLHSQRGLALYRMLFCPLAAFLVLFMNKPTNQNKCISDVRQSTHIIIGKILTQQNMPEHWIVHRDQFHVSYIFDLSEFRLINEILSNYIQNRDSALPSYKR